jgi:hypothetical protein
MNDKLGWLALHHEHTGEEYWRVFCGEICLGDWVNHALASLVKR